MSLAARRRLASLAILCLLGGQLLAISRVLCPPRFLGLGAPCVAPAPALWPFLDYPMFDEAHRLGERVWRDTAVAELATGGARRLAPGRDGRLAHELVEALRAGEARALERLAAELEALAGEGVRALRLEREELVLTRAGFVRGTWLEQARWSPRP